MTTPDAPRCLPTRSPAPGRGWRWLRDRLRTVFILFHCLAVLAFASPSTAAALKRSSWEDPTVKAEFAAWAPRLRLTPAELSDRLWDIAKRWNAGRQHLVAPFAPYARLSGMGQTWQMFVAPHTFPTRLQLQERRAADPVPWVTLFEERSREATWMASTLGVERMRASIFRWGWPAYKEAYASACRALAARRFQEDHDTVGFRCRFSRARTRSAAEVSAGVPEVRSWLPAVTVERPPG